jgi:hypothetical protein
MFIHLQVAPSARPCYIEPTPRNARINPPGAVHPVTVRGIGRRNMLPDLQDRKNGLARLEITIVETNTPCFAWALMSNPVQLLHRNSRVPFASARGVNAFSATAIL